MVDDRTKSVVRPEAIIPFAVSQEQALQCYNSYQAEREFLPDDFTAQSSVVSVQGVYVPHWLYSGTVDFDFTFNWSDTRRDHDLWGYKRRAGTYTFANIPADASRIMDDALMDSVEPYDFDALVPFSEEYLSGFAAEYATVDAQEAGQRAARRAKNAAANAIEETLEFERWEARYIEKKNSSAVETFSSCRRVLLPVWLITVRYQGEDIPVGVNGQTGKVAVNLPIDEQKQKHHLRKEGRVDFWILFIIAAIIGVCGIAFVGYDLYGKVWLFGMQEINADPYLHRQFVFSILKIAGFAALPFVAGALNMLFYRSQYKKKVSESMQNVQEAFDTRGYQRGSLNITLSKPKKGPAVSQNNWPPLE